MVILTSFLNRWGDEEYGDFLENLENLDFDIMFKDDTDSNMVEINTFGILIPVEFWGNDM